MNPQPLHADAQFAARTQWGRPAFGSPHTLGVMIGMSAGIQWLRIPDAHPALVLVRVVARGIGRGAGGPVMSTLAARIFAPGPVASILGTVVMAIQSGPAPAAWVPGFLHDPPRSCRAVPDGFTRRTARRP